MRILHLAPDLFEPGSMGGGERYVQELMRAQEALGATTSIAAVRGPSAIRIRRSMDGPVTVASSDDLTAVARDVDALHVHQYKMRVFEAAQDLRRTLKLPLFLTDHGGTTRFAGRLRGSRRLDGVRAFMPVSPWSARDVDPRKRIGEPIVLWGGGDHLPTPIEREVSRTDFLFVGRLLPHKGVHVLLASLPKGSSLRIVGETRDEEYRRRLEQLARGKDVVFEGAPADEALPSFYRASDFTVLPSVLRFGRHRYPRPELLGLVVLEAIAAGSRVIGSRLGGLAEVLEKAGQTAVLPGNVRAWSSALEERLAQPGPLPSSESFTWKSSAGLALAGYERFA